MKTAITHLQLSRLERMIGDIAKQKERESTRTRIPRILEWCEENLLLKPFAGGLVAFKANQFQRDLISRVQDCLDNKKPIRIIILKSRQLGMSTCVEAILFFLITHYPNTNALVVAHKRDTSRHVYNMTKLFYKMLPPEERRPLEGSKPNKDSLDYGPPHNSRMLVMTAGSSEVGRGFTVQFCHASEMAFWEDAESAMLALNQAIPKPSDTWFSAYFIESTGNQNNLFRDYWDRAQRKDSIWVPVFYSWRDDPECRIKATPGEPVKLDKDENDFMWEHKLDLEQMLWARAYRNDQCSGSWAKFNQEYPVSPGLAFTSHGWAVFKTQIIDRQIEVAREMPPEFVGDVSFLSSTKPVPEFIPNQYGPLCVWEWPKRDCDYVIGCDVGTGIGADYSEVIVLKKHPVEVVAQWRDNRTQAQDVAIRVWLLGQHYYQALLGVERNTIGLIILGVLEHGHGDREKFPLMYRYPNLYYDTVTDRKTQEESHRLGFSTSNKTKHGAITRCAELFSDGDLTVWSIPLLNQMRGFAWEPETKKFVQTKKDDMSELYNDDGVMALSIANEMRLFAFGARFMPKIKRGDW